MQSRRSGLVYAALGVVLAVALFVVLSGGEDDPPADGSATSETPAAQPAGAYGAAPAQQGPEQAPATGRLELPVIELKGGEPVGGFRELEFIKGEEIRVEVSSDAAYAIHLHGYDVTEDVAAGGSAVFDLPAEIEGVFEIEIEDTATPIAEISVVPG